MKILYIDYNMFGKEDIIDTFRILGCEVDVTDCPMITGEFSAETRKQLETLLVANEYEAAFTSNYYPMVSDVCNDVGVKYISWTYDSPRIALYDRSINNPFNYAFVFDSCEYERLRDRGAGRVFYMPLGVNTSRVNSITMDDNDAERFSSEVSIVASLYNEEHNLYDRLYEKVDDYTRGFMEAVVSSQRNIFGGDIIDASLNSMLIDTFRKCMPYELDNGSLADYGYIYADYFLARKAATYQRKDFIKRVSKDYQLKVYTSGDISDIPTAVHMGTVDYSTDMNKVFKLSKINLNITLPSIRSGIPLRVLDIMGAGGFLLTDYRMDFSDVIEPGIDMVCYTSIEDAVSKIDYYLNHEDERREIAANGRRKIEQCFRYEDRLGDMIDIVEKQ